MMQFLASWDCVHKTAFCWLHRTQFNGQDVSLWPAADFPCSRSMVDLCGWTVRL